jgi:hypothetical protein
MAHPFRKLLVPAAFIILLLPSCSLFDKDEPIPAYIRIDHFNLVANPAGFGSNSPETGNEGSLSHKITDAWVYVDETFLGCFELPVTIPAIYEGVHHVRIKPGIKVNGIAATRAPYPFYKLWEQDVDFQKGTAVTLNPSTMYESSSHFVNMDDFEGISIIDTTSNSQVDINTTSDPAYVFEGSKSGFAYLKPGETFFECESPYKVLPKGSSPVFLEFNYKCDQQFTVGVVAQSPFRAEPILNLNPTSSWNKAYLYLTPSVTPTSAINYKVLFFMGSAGSDSTAFLIDNIKIVY